MNFLGLPGAALPGRLLKQKKWQYVLIGTPQVALAVAIFDAGYLAKAFAVAVDLAREQVLFDRSALGPPGPLGRVGDRPGEGLSAYFRTLNGWFECSRPAGNERYQLSVRSLGVPKLWPGLSCSAEVLAVGGPPALTVISPVEGGGIVNVTQKWAGLLSFGSLKVAGRTFSLDGGVAGMDYTQGLLARHTAWRWAMAVGRLEDGTPVGLNLVEGFNDSAPQARENALWLGDRLLPLSSARFSFNKQDYLDPWEVHTEDGAVSLKFRPIHVHREVFDYQVVKSRFIQPVGRFEGTIEVDGRKLPVALTGVTEDQDVLW